MKLGYVGSWLQEEEMRTMVPKSELKVSGLALPFRDITNRVVCSTCAPGAAKLVSLHPAGVVRHGARLYSSAGDVHLGLACKCTELS